MTSKPSSAAEPFTFGHQSTGAGARARELFTSGYNCAESVFLAGAEALGRSVLGVIPSIATTFGGGMHLGGACGALTGALMTIGLAVGRRDGSDQERKDLATKLGAEFGHAFADAFGHLNCHDLTGHNLLVAEEAAHWRAINGRNTFCAPAVERSADQLVVFLKEHGLLGRES